MGGSKGGSQTVEMEASIPSWAEGAAQYNIDRARQAGELGYVPFYGPDVAALSPMQMAAGQNIRGAAAAFGMDGGQSALPEAQTFAGGVRGDSSGDHFEESLQRLKEERPGQYAAYMSMFIDPYTGRPRADGQGGAGGGMGGDAAGYGMLGVQQPFNPIQALLGGGFTGRNPRPQFNPATGRPFEDQGMAGIQGLLARGAVAR